MKVKYLKQEAVGDYRKTYMFIGMPRCTFKCCRDCGMPVSICQNSEWAKLPDIEVDDQSIIDGYLGNPITSAIVFGGLDPMDSFDDLYGFVKRFRSKCQDDVVVYTGYYPNEIQDKIERLRPLGNVIVKFGRYVPNAKAVYDQVLGVMLASDNQFAVRLDEIAIST